MHSSRTARLGLMMFLQFFVWGAWYVTVGNFMTSIGWGEHVYLPYLVNPIAAIVAPFFIGMVADRYFATQKILGVLHIIGGVSLILAPRFAAGGDASVWPFVTLILIHVLCYMPTLGLANSLAFHNISNQEKQFPFIRVFGTAGWIVANLVVSPVLHADQSVLQFYVAGGAGLGLGLYCFSLPHTPAPAAGQRPTVGQVLGLDALRVLWSRQFAVFVVSSMLICIPLAAYYSYAPVFVGVSGANDPAGWMSIGQMTEVAFMLLIPLFFVRLGVKRMLLVGMAAWVLRYTLFAIAAPASLFWVVVLGVALHGICYDFFFVTGQIYVDKRSTPEIRGQAQGLLVLATYGIGMLVGARVAGWFYNNLLSDGAEVLTPAQFQTFWIAPAIFAAAVMLFFAATFRDGRSNAIGVPE